MKPIYLLLFTFLFPHTLSAQLKAEEEKAIDKIFESWDQAAHPGGAVGLMQNGKLLYSKAFGLASLEYKVPNTYGTQFNIASVSKQFTSMGIVRLAEMGKLNLEDDIRKHLPELPDFGHKISLKHCMYHTSGMRSLHAMLEMAGWRWDDARTDEDLFRFMQRQKELNFAPGEDYLYCNTGYMLLAVIIERISGESFPLWMEKNIFEPLAMYHTYVEDDYSRVVANNATSYYEEEGSWSRAVEYWGYVGSGNIHATVEDLLSWMNYFISPPNAWKDSFASLQEVGNLNNGKSINYGFGININEYNGEKFIGHGGAIGGFISNAVCFPKKGLSIVILTNFNSAGPQGKVFQIADILLKNKEEKVTNPNTPLAINPIKLSRSKLQKFEGQYWNVKDNFTRKIYLKSDTLRYFRSEGNETLLLPIEENKFQMLGLPFLATVEFPPTNGKEVKQMIFRQPNEGAIEIFEFFEEPIINETFLAKFVGQYYSPELDTHYSISRDKLNLSGYHNRHGAFEVKVRKKDFLLTDNGAFREIKVVWGEDGEVSGFYVSNGRVRNLWFEKR
ncbi:MAG: serine hydrolase domain-containing protein [Bacteroidota bacterium]